MADPSLWRTLDLSNSQRPERVLRYVATQPCILAALQELNLEFAAGVTDALLTPLRGAFLEALNLNGCQQCVRLTFSLLHARAAPWKAS